MASGRVVSHQEFVRYGCCSKKVYEQAQRTVVSELGAAPRISLRELLLQHGCFKLEGAVKALMDAYKRRFLAQLPQAEQASAPASQHAALVIRLTLHKAKGEW